MTSPRFQVLWLHIHLNEDLLMTDLSLLKAHTIPASFSMYTAKGDKAVHNRVQTIRKQLLEAKHLSQSVRVLEIAVASFYAMSKTKSYSEASDTDVRWSFRDQLVILVQLRHGLMPNAAEAVYENCLLTCDQI